MSTTEDIEWGYNCLTQGVHHGRPEKIWNLPLLYATEIYSKEELQQLVISRIFNDAMQYVEHGEGDQTKGWANRIKELATERYLRTLQVKVGEIDIYYTSLQFQQDAQDAIERVQNNKLNPGYAPLHPHDSINMLCRILGTGCSIEASKDS